MIYVFLADSLFVQDYVIANRIEGVLKSLSMCLTSVMYAAVLSLTEVERFVVLVGI